MSASVLETRDVRCTFSVRQGLFKPKRPLHAVNGVSLTLRKGEVLGLVGESGCGKSTLARMLLGLQAPTGGEILFEGQSIGRLDRASITRKIQTVFQDPYSSLNPRKSISSIVSLPLRVHKIGNPADWQNQVERMLDMVGLPRRVYHSYPNQLSGGQRQRVAIARALIMRPEVIICDEPTSSLDVSVQAQILNLLRELRQELGLTYLLISHNLAVIDYLASRIAVMHLGRIVEEGTTDTIMRQPSHPYTKALLASVLTPEPGLGVPATDLGTSFPSPLAPPPGCTFHPRCPAAMQVCKEAAPKPRAQADGGMVECHLYT
ncbi:MAG: ABC transporter ATP-binding protein [Rhodospirillaceae bacterium]|nr:ABC transporter ATP-binding protein [Rhodospirillaceae bacterium]